MQSEPTDVSQHTPSVDSPPAQPNSTQHGNDIADGPVSGPPHGEAPASGNPAVPGRSTPGLTCPSLNDAAIAPPSSPASRVIQHENAGTPGRRGAELGFRVVTSASPSELALDSLPNGTPEPKFPANQLQLTILRRGPHPYPVSSASSVAFCHHTCVSSVPCSGHDTSCLENCIFPVLPGPLRRRERAPHSSGGA